MIGQTISHYKITAKLGAGGMGVVYKALDLKLERTVALKFLPNDVAITERDKESLLREARAASALDHPNTGVIYGLEESGDHHLYIVMGYYEGETLAQKLSRGLIPVRESLDLAIQIASGLSAAHARNIIHRDIKPSNIIITEENVAKIVDFGLARVVASSSATQSLQVSGTLPYMAPEQVLGEPIDPRCDIWALGVILVQMLTGSHPFLRENTAAMTFAILNQPPAALDAVPPLLQPIAYRALSKKPEHRYSDAKEMLADLEAARLQIKTAPAGTPQDAATLTNAVSARELEQAAERASTPRWQTASQQKSRAPVYATVGLLGGAILVSGLLLITPLRERAAALLHSGGESHIAVLPFDNIGNDPSNEVLAAGLMDSLTSKLSNLDAAQKSLWVVPSSVVRNRKISDPAAALRELGANLVVKGSIQRQGQDVQMTLNLIDAKTLRQVGSAALEDRTGDLATLQNEAVSRLARLMNINVSAALLRDTGGSATPAAYESYLKALGLIQRYDKPGNLDQAITVLNDAVKTDPKFALGYASLGEAYRLKNQVDPNPKWTEQASAMLERAVQLDDRLPSPYVSLGRLHSSLAKHDLALQEFQKVLAINPRDADAIKGIAGAYERMGRVRDAEDSYKRAVALKPDYWDGYNSLGFFYYRQNRFSDAINQFRRVIELTPDNSVAHSNLAGAYQRTGDPKLLSSAEAELKKSIQLSPSYGAYANLGNVYMEQGKYAEAVHAIGKALEFNDKDFRIWNNLLNAYRWLGDEENANKIRLTTKELVEQYVSAHPEEAEVRALLSNFYAVAGLKARCQQEIDTALALQPRDPDVLANIAESYETLGDRPHAAQFAKSSLTAGGTITDLQSRPGLQNLLHDPNFRASGNKSPN